MQGKLVSDEIRLGFDRLYEFATENNYHQSKELQVIAVISSKGNMYKFQNDFTVKDDELGFINMLKEKDDTQIDKIVCVWPDGQVDLTSYSFRKSLCELNSKNSDAYIILQGEFSYNLRKICETF